MCKNNVFLQDDPRYMQGRLILSQKDPLKSLFRLEYFKIQINMGDNIINSILIFLIFVFISNIALY